MADEGVVDTTRPELPLAARLFLSPSDSSCACRHPSAFRRHSRLHSHVLAARSCGCVAVCALCRLGGVRISAERFDPNVELGMSNDRRTRIRATRTSSFIGGELCSNKIAGGEIQGRLYDAAALPIDDL